MNHPEQRPPEQRDPDQPLAEQGPPPTRPRRPPPPFRHMEVRRIERLSARMLRVTFAGPQLQGLVVEHPASSVRLLLPSPGKPTLEVPEWTGNEFLLPDGQRPTLRTFTPCRVDPHALELTLDIVIHQGGAASQWAQAAGPGDPAAISGPGRGYTIDSHAPAFLLAGDETAIPAISQLLAAVPPGIPVQVHIELAPPFASIALPLHPAATIEWHHLPLRSTPGDALVTAVANADLVAGQRVWIAGEAASVQRVRRHLFEDRGLPRADTSVRGYWQRGRHGDGDGPN